MKNKLFIVVDMQNDFVTGSLANPAAEKIIPNIVEKLKAKDYTYLIFTRDTHQKNYLETQEGKNLPVEHCIEGTKGWEIVPELQEFTKNAFIIDKPTFGYKDWKAKLNELFDDEFFDFLGKHQLLTHRVSRKYGNIFFDIEVYLKNSAFGSISSASISLIIVLSLGSVLILLFFMRFCLDMPVLLDISFQEMSFSKAISSILFQNSEGSMYGIV